MTGVVYTVHYYLLMVSNAEHNKDAGGRRKYEQHTVMGEFCNRSMVA